jgi:hypothetical protein
VDRGDIGPDDTTLLFSMDGAHLYQDKKSDCWIYVWVILNMSFLEVLSLGPTSLNIWSHSYFPASITSPLFRRKALPYTTEPPSPSQEPTSSCCLGLRMALVVFISPGWSGTMVITSVAYTVASRGGTNQQGLISTVLSSSLITMMNLGVTTLTSTLQALVALIRRGTKKISSLS